MALTDSVISQGRGKVADIKSGIQYIGSELGSLIQLLNANENFKAFCAGTPKGEEIHASLKTIQATISQNLVSGIDNLAQVTEGFLDSQEAINKMGGGASRFGVAKGFGHLLKPAYEPWHVELHPESSTFSVLGFQMLTSSIKQCLGAIAKTTTNTANTCSEVSSLFASEDSNLSGSYAKISEVLMSIANKLNDIATRLVAEIDGYVAATLDNEQYNETQVNSINSTLEDIMGIIGNI